jgi:hypothetical protein
MQLRASQRNPELRRAWIRKLTTWTADQLLFLDESACDERTAHRKYGWAPIGITPHEYVPFKRSERWSILPVYTVDGFITWELKQGSYTAESFEEFIENQVLPRCNPFPGPRSIIVMDNAPIHQSEVYLDARGSLINSGSLKYARMPV